MGWIKNLMGSFSTKVQNTRQTAAAPKNDEPAPDDVVGTYQYGMRLLEQENVEKALLFLRRAAERGYPDAQYHLAVIYNDGTGVMSDIEQANMWFRKAADSGNTDAQYKLSLALESGNHVKRDPKGALQYLKKAAAAGNLEALSHYADKFLYGDEEAGIHNDLEQAIGLLEVAAKKGFEAAQIKLGKIYWDERYGYHDVTAAINKWMMPAIRGNRDAEYYLALAYRELGKEGESNKWLRAAADKFQPDALKDLKAMNGEG